jgi:ribosome-binding ATPase YchF (GTP1/OBG family)
VGKPSSGKSTLINALTKSDIAKTGAYPFTTIDSNRGTGFAYKKCVCREMEKQCKLCINISNSETLRPIQVKLVDVAGLVPGAHEGRGLGNKFLSDLSEADILLHVVDISGSLNEEGEEVPIGSYDPIKDVNFLEDEISFWIAGILEHGWDKIKRTARSTKTPVEDVLAERLSGVKINRHQIKKVFLKTDLNLPLDIGEWTKEEITIFSKEVRAISKPIIIVANKIDRPKALENLERLKEHFPAYEIIPVSALSDILLQNLHNKEKIEYKPLEGKLKKLNLTDKESATIDKIQENILNKFENTGVPFILTKSIDLLEYIIAFPVADIQKLTDGLGDNVLPDSFLLPKGTTAKEFAGYVHKDLYDSFVCGIDARTSKKLSESYEVKDRDIIKIQSSK